MKENLTNQDSNKTSLFFYSICSENHIGVLSKNPFDIDEIKTIYLESTLTFLEEYKKHFSVFEKNIAPNNCSETASTAIILFKFIYLNVAFKLDAHLLIRSLEVLSEMIQQLESKYLLDKYENKFGAVIARDLNMKVHEFWEIEDNDTQNFILNAISQITVTNNILAGWVYFALKRFGIRVPKKLTKAHKALYFFDHLVGTGIDELLLNNTKEKVEKKLEVLNVVGMDDLSKKILGFYLCKTGNEKRRFLSEIKEVISNVNITERINSFLIDS